MKKFIMILLFLNITFVQADIVNLDELYSYNMLYEDAQNLVDTYPELLKLVELGRSEDGRLIFALVMTENVDHALNAPEAYVEKMHFFFEAGIHSRENPGPVVLLKSIELYCQDYYDDSIIAEYHLSSILKNHVLHFIPISNPDGYNLANRGLYTISKENQNQLLSFNDQNFRQYKANINGVDLNRNFPGDYYDLESGQWHDIWNKVHNDYRSYRPSGAFYPGPEAASEKETQILMNYVMSEDFRSYISYHSKGMVVYYYKWMLSDQHNATTRALASTIANDIRYELVKNSEYESSSGYLTDYTSMLTLKPSITVESVWWRRTLPVNQSVIKATFDELKYLPLLVTKEGEKTGYYRYKLYKDGIYIRDFEEYAYAKAMADRMGGKVYIYQGYPKLYIDLEKNYVRRQEFIEILMSDVDTDLELVAFADCDNELVLKARALGYISGYNNYFRPNDFISYEEVYVVLSKVFFKDYQLKNEYSFNASASWAREGIKILAENDILDLRDLTLGRITLQALKALLDNIKSGG